MLETRDKLITFEAWFFTRRRIWLHGSGVIAAYTIGLAARSFGHSWMFEARGKPSCIDFSHIWVSGALAASGDPALIYNYAAFSVVRSALGSAVDCVPVLNQFVYPPIYLFFVYPLGLMPYVAAFVA